MIRMPSRRRRAAIELVVVAVLMIGWVAAWAVAPASLALGQSRPAAEWAVARAGGVEVSHTIGTFFFTVPGGPPIDKVRWYRLPDSRVVAVVVGTGEVVRLTVRQGGGGKGSETDADRVELPRSAWGLLPMAASARLRS